MTANRSGSHAPALRSAMWCRKSTSLSFPQNVSPSTANVGTPKIPSASAPCVAESSSADVAGSRRAHRGMRSLRRRSARPAARIPHRRSFRCGPRTSPQTIADCIPRRCPAAHLRSQRAPRGRDRTARVREAPETARRTARPIALRRARDKATRIAPIWASLQRDWRPCPPSASSCRAGATPRHIPSPGPTLRSAWKRDTNISCRSRHVIESTELQTHTRLLHPLMRMVIIL